jgi:hypothetical protein
MKQWILDTIAAVDMRQEVKILGKNRISVDVPKMHDN